MNIKRSFRPCVALIALSLAGRSLADEVKPLDLVSTLQGTDSHGGMSHGNTLPLVGPPWPMTHWAPQTQREGRRGDTSGWWFRSTSDQVYGFRATRQPSPWMGDYGQFAIQPTTGDLVANPRERASPYDLAASTYRPDYVAIDLKRYDVKAEMTSSDRCGVLRFTFNSGDTGRLYFDPARVSHVEIDGRTVRGYSTHNSGGVPKGWRAYFVAKLDRDVTGFGTFADQTPPPAPGQREDRRAESRYSVSQGNKGVDGDRVGAYVEFATGQQRAVTLTVGTSYIGYEQAEANLDRETDGGFDATRRRTADAWNKNLGKVKLTGGTDEQRRTFYSCLYRSQTFPHKLHELNDDGRPFHQSVYDGKLHDGVAYGDIGFWDVYRTNFQLWSILFPDELGEMLTGFLSGYKEGGWLAQWPSPGYRVSMIGTHTDPVFADAIIKNLKGFDPETAYAAIRRHAFDKPDRPMVGRNQFDEYTTLGYLPATKDGGYRVSETLDYAYDDWSIAQAAKKLGKTADYDKLIERSKNYKTLWDPATGFFRAKKADGTWFQTPEQFDQYAWSTGYVEGGPWQCNWAVPHDVEGMAGLFGGKDKMAAALDRMMGLPPTFHPGEYRGIIHEMIEMAVVPFGQYAHGNQPVHHVLYLFNALGQPEKTQYWTRQVCLELYNSGPKGFAGDEDNGEMASWYVLSSMGLFQLCMGDPTYTLTTPIFDAAELSLPNGKTLTIKTKNQGPANAYVNQRTLDGKPFAGHTIGYDALLNGGTMEVELSPVPAKR